MCTKYTASDYSTYLTFCQSYTSSVKCFEQLIVFCTNSKSFIIILCSITTSKCKNVIKFCVHISPIFSCRVTNNDRCRVSLISLFSLSFPSYHPWFSSEFCDARGSGLSVALSLFNFSSCVEFHLFYHYSQPFIFFIFFTVITSYTYNMAVQIKCIYNTAHLSIQCATHKPLLVKSDQLEAHSNISSSSQLCLNRSL